MQIKGHIHYNSDLDKLDLAFWIEDAGQVVSSALGPLNWQFYDMEGTIFTDPHATGSGITPNMAGVYSIAEINNPTYIQSGTSYLLYVSAVVGEASVSTFLSAQITNI